MDFNSLSIGDDLKEAIAEMGLSEMTEIQEKAVPILLDGADVIGKSQTGTGKTLAFAIPAVSKIDTSINSPQVLVLLPTRELALQVAGEFEKLLKFTRNIRVSAVFGGASMEKQFRELRRGAQVVVGTPGRVMDHMRRGTLRFDALRMVVLDEADEMLDMGFYVDIMAI